MAGSAGRAPRPLSLGVTAKAEDLALAADIGDHVRRLRLIAGLSQHELACRSATSQPAIAHLEAGRRVPTLATLTKLARALGHDLVLVLPARGTSCVLDSNEEASA